MKYLPYTDIFVGAVNLIPDKGGSERRNAVAGLVHRIC
jgi:hypothetical protein